MGSPSKISFYEVVDIEDASVKASPFKSEKGRHLRSSNDVVGRIGDTVRHYSPTVHTFKMDACQTNFSGEGAVLAWITCFDFAAIFGAQTLRRN